MKKIILTVGLLLAGVTLYAQAPQKMTYQSVIRNSSDALISNSSVGIQISILQGSVSGTAVYIERHTPTTNINGLATLEIGTGTVVAGSFGTIDWSSGPYFIKTETDPNGGTTYSISGTSQLLSVPYALYAENSGDGFSGDYNDLTNVPTNVSSFTNDAGYVTTSNDADADPTNEIQTLNQAGSTVTLSNGGGTITVNDNDSDPTNEYQTLSINGSDLTISNGNTITLPAGSGGGNTLDGAYDQGGPGLGRTITTDAGAVQIINSGSNTTGLDVSSAVTNSTGVLSTHSGIGVAFRAESTNPSNSFSAIQANTNSSVAVNSAILGNNAGAGYGVTGQIPNTATGEAGVYGNNLRTTGGYGVLGIGYNGTVGQSNYPAGFGIYGSNSGVTGLSIGTYGIGFNGVYGQTTDVINGWSGYFTQDIGVDGAGYAVGGWITASDKRLKSDIVPIESPLEKLKMIHGRYYTIESKSKPYNSELLITTRKQYGVIAQDVEKVFPEMVSEKAIFNNAGDDTLYKTVNYDQLIPVLIEAVKELNLKVEELQKEVDELKEDMK